MSTPAVLSSLDQLLEEKQHAIVKWFLLWLSLALIPFDVNHFLQGRALSGWILAGLLLLNVLTVASVHYRQKLLVPHAVVMVPVGLMLGVSIVEQGVLGVVWVYPVLLVAHIFLSRRLSNLAAVLLIGMATGLSYAYISPGVAVRVAVTLLLTSIFANIFLHTISRLTSYMNDLATVDPLTGVYNRRHLADCAHWPAELKRRYGTPMSVLLLDADHFKRVNDRFGHAVGDEVLKELAARVRAAIRTIDLLFRLGGEEFLVMLPESALDSARRVAEKLCEVLRETPLAGHHRVTVSIGVAELASGEDFDTLLRRCDAALYRAKAEGRDRVVVAAAPPA